MSTELTARCDVLTQDAHSVGLDLGVRHLLVDCVALDVDVPVVVTNTEGNVGHCPPAPLL